MDYPHPVLKLGSDGGILAQDAYGTGTGPWDEYIVKHVYGQYANEAEALARARRR